MWVCQKMTFNKNGILQQNLKMTSGFFNLLENIVIFIIDLGRFTVIQRTLFLCVIPHLPPTLHFKPLF